MNLLKIAEQKKQKLQSLAQVKLDAVKSEDGIVVLTETDAVMPSAEIIGFEDNTVFVSGMFASKFSFLNAIRKNRI